MVSRSLKRATAAAFGGLMLVGAVSASPANAFSSSSSLTSGGVTYKASAESCNLYWSSCSWSASSSSSVTKTFTHRADVKANGISVSISISADPSASISGNSTTLATATERGTGRSNSMSGVAKPSIFSVSVAARSRLTVGTVTVNSGWTTW